MQTKSRFIACALASLLWTTAALADDSHCEDGVGRNNPSTPDREFTDMGNGVVQHARTGLQWSRCAIGQTWSSGRCQNAADVFLWGEAQKAIDQLNRTGRLGGHSNWRLPTVEELATLIEKCREAPAINTDIFPNTPWSGFWTSTLHFDGKNRLDDYEPEHVEIDAVAGAHPDEDDDKRDIFPEEAWFVGFYKGLEYPYDINSSYRLRPVREP